MKINNYLFPKSSFLSIEKDLEIITNAMLKNQRFKKLLHFICFCSSSSFVNGKYFSGYLL